MKKELDAVQNPICYVGLKTILRPLNIETDLESCWKWINDPEVNRYLLANSPVSLEEERRFFERVSQKNSDSVCFAVETLEDRKFIGTVGVNSIRAIERIGNSGSLIGEKEYWGQGYGTDAKILLLNHAFNTMNLIKVNSSVTEFNERSAGALKKQGYVQEGVVRQDIFREGKYWDRIIFGLLRSEFEPLWSEYSRQLQIKNEGGYYSHDE